MPQSSDTDGDGPPPTPITLAVYRDLRVGLAVTMAMLAVAIIIDLIMHRCWQGALSEYFYTPAHSIFIATLLGLATLFFVYRGSSDTEDALLTLAGVAALIAALVPQDRPEACKPPPFLPKDVDVDAAVVPNLVAVVVALVLGWALSWWQRCYNKSHQTRSLGGTLALYFLRLVVVAALLCLALKTDWFLTHAHGAAGVLLLSAFIATVFTTAYLAKKEEPAAGRRDYRGFYKWIARGMLVTLIGIVTLHITRPDWFHIPWVTALETALILEFLAYWVAQTWELWDTPDRTERLSDADQKRLAHRCTKSGLAGLKCELLEVKNAPAGKKLMTFL